MASGLGVLPPYQIWCFHLSYWNQEPTPIFCGRGSTCSQGLPWRAERRWWHGVTGMGAAGSESSPIPLLLIHACFSGHALDSDLWFPRSSACSEALGEAPGHKCSLTFPMWILPPWD